MIPRQFHNKAPGPDAYPACVQDTGLHHGTTKKYSDRVTDNLNISPYPSLLSVGVLKHHNKKQHVKRKEFTWPTGSISSLREGRAEAQGWNGSRH